MATSTPRPATDGGVASQIRAKVRVKETSQMKSIRILLTAALCLIMSAIALQAASPPTTATLANQVAALQAEVKGLHAQLLAINQNNALKLGPFVTVDLNQKVGVVGPNIVFHGANIHIVNGMGSTAIINGTGNLIIGYDEDPGLAPTFTFPGQVPIPFGGTNGADGTPVVLQTGDRGGSHNLVIGRWHKFTRTAFGGFLGGEFNKIQNEADSITGGLLNISYLQGKWATIVGGAMNSTGAGELSTILGGEFNGTGGATFCTVVGGYSNAAQNYYAVTLGGQDNVCGGQYSVILGGFTNYLQTPWTIAPTDFSQANP